MGRVISIERLNNHFRSIWTEFLKYEEDFESLHSYGVNDIKRIGIKKFIQAEDWNDPKDASKFLTDALHVGICPNCNQEYAISETDFGLCNTCKPKFDLKEMIALALEMGDKATIQLLEGKDTTDEIKALIREKAALLSEFALTAMIRGSHPGSDIYREDYWLITGSVLKKEKKTVTSIEELNHLRDILEAATLLVKSRLEEMFAFDVHD